MAVTGVSGIPEVIQKVISTQTTKTLQQLAISQSIAGVWDRSGEVGPGMDRLDMISLAELAVQSVDEAGGAMTPQTINPSADYLNLDQHKSVPFSLTKRGDLQSKIALVQKTLEIGLVSLAADVDNYVFTQAVAAAGSTVTAAAADALAALRGLAKSFDDANVPKMGRSAIVGTSFLWDELLANNNVIKANEFGSSEPIRVAKIANIYGIDLYESTSSAIPSDGFLGMGMEAMAFARQRMVEFEEEKKVLEQRTDYAISHLFGAASTAASNPRIYVYNPA